MNYYRFLNETDIKNLYEFLQRHHTIQFDIETFTEWCKRYEVRNCDLVGVHLPHNSRTDSCMDLELKRREKDGSYTRYSDLDFFWGFVEPLSPEERAEAIKE